MLSWGGIDRPMQMRETSRGQDKKLAVNNLLKKSQAVMDKVLPELRQRTIENGYEPRIADQLVKLIEPFVGYGFNRSHAAA